MAKVSSALLKRRLEIAEIVRKCGEIKVDELSDILQVSHVTIRQDLTYLEHQGYLKRFFGKAIYISPEDFINNSTSVYPSRLASYFDVDNNDIKLVTTCLNYINNGDTIFLSHGSLIRKLIPFLHNKKYLTVILNDLNNAQLVKEFSDAEVILIGGVLDKSNVLKHSNLFSSIINQFSISNFIFEFSAINTNDYLVIQDIEYQEIYQQILKNADHSIGILPPQIKINDNNTIGKLKNTDVIVLSRSVVNEYHQQLLNSNFKQVTTDKYCVTYHNVLED